VVRPPHTLTAFVRRMLGVYVRKPGQVRIFCEACGERRLIASHDLTNWPRGPAE
jgi:hypothetical protein